MLVGDTRFIERDGGYWTSGNLRRPLVEALARTFGSVKVAMRVREATPVEWENVPHADIIRVPGVEFVHLPTWNGPSGWFGSRAAVGRILRRHIPTVDVCVARLPCPPAGLSVALAGRLKVPVIAHVLGDPLFSWIDRVPTAVGRHFVTSVIASSFSRALSSCDSVLSTSRGVLMPYMPDVSGVGRLADTSLTDPDYIKPRQRTRPHVLFFCASRIVPLKNFDLLLHALRIVVKHCPQVQCTIAGDGPDLARLRLLTSDLGLESHVTFLGFVRDRLRLRQHYEDADVAFLLSRSEGLPLAVLEAMAAGLPLLVSEIPQNREVADEMGAIFVGCDDRDACAAAIRSLITDPDRRRKMAQHNFELAGAFHVDVQVRRLAASVEQVLSHG